MVGDPADAPELPDVRNDPVPEEGAPEPVPDPPDTDPIPEEENP